MAEIGRWGGHKFIVSPTLIRGFSGLEIKGSSETEEKKSGSEKYVKRKNAKPTQISLTVHLMAQLGVDVRGEAMGFVSDAQKGKTDYFYIANAKLITASCMLTSANVSKTVLAPTGKWVSADVALTLQQCSKSDGSSGGSKKKSKKKNKKSSSKKTVKKAKKASKSKTTGGGGTVMRLTTNVRAIM